MMRHRRQCRADAVGLLGDDRSSEFTIEKVMVMDVQYDLETRKAYQAKIEDEPAARITTRQEEFPELAGEPERHARYEVAIRIADDESACLIADEGNMLQKSTSARVSVRPAGSRGGGA